MSVCPTNIEAETLYTCHLLVNEFYLWRLMKDTSGEIKWGCPEQYLPPEDSSSLSFSLETFPWCYKGPDAAAVTLASLASPLQRTVRALLHNTMGNVSDERGVFFHNHFCIIGHQMVIIFYGSVKSAEIKAMYYTLQRALLIQANHIRAWTTDEGLVTGNLTLKEFQTQTKSISLHITRAA